jgi:hypothetical protein
MSKTLTTTHRRKHTINEYHVVARHVFRIAGRCSCLVGPRALACCRAQNVSAPPAWETFSDKWVGVDGLGRPLPTHDEGGGPRPDHHTGIFYFAHTKDALPVRDTAQILKADPDAPSKPDSPQWNPEETQHFWGEPLFGYYSIRDPAILRKHAQMLNDASIEMLLFDTASPALRRIL